MRDIRFGAGYYEWNVIVDDELYYSFKDICDYLFSEKESNEDYTENEWLYMIDDLVRSMIDDDEYFEEHNEIEPLTKDELDELKRQMFNVLTYNYGIKEE